MYDFSINDVRFHRTAVNRCLVIVYGQTVGDVQRLADPSDPADPDLFRYRSKPCTLHFATLSGDTWS